MIAVARYPLFLFTLIVLLLEQSQCVLPFTVNKSPIPSPTTTSRSMGGYDATIGIKPNLPIQFFTTPGNTCPYAARTMIVLKELNIDFEMTGNIML